MTFSLSLLGMISTCFLISFLAAVTPITAQQLIRQKRNADNMGQMIESFNQDISDLQDAYRASEKVLGDLKGFLSAIGIGVSAINSRSSRCGDGWSEFTGSTCVKVIPALYNQDEAKAQCKNQFDKNRDVDLPSLIYVDTAEKQDIIVDKLTLYFPRVISVWIEHGEEFTNGDSARSRGSGRGCTELRNGQGYTGGWVDVSCSSKSSIICEKTMSIPYSHVIRNHAQFHGIIEDMENKTQQLDSKVSDVQQELTDLKRGGALGNAAEVGRIKTKVTVLEGRIRAFETEVNHQLRSTPPPPTVDTFAESRTIALESRVRELEAKIMSMLRSTSSPRTVDTSRQKIVELERRIRVIEADNLRRWVSSTSERQLGNSAAFYKADNPLTSTVTTEDAYDNIIE